MEALTNALRITRGLITPGLASWKAGSRGHYGQEDEVASFEQPGRVPRVACREAREPREPRQIPEAPGGVPRSCISRSMASSLAESGVRLIDRHQQRLLSDPYL